MTEQEFRQNIVNEALGWKGSKYHLGARVKGVACDCATLILATLQNVGVIPPDEEAHRFSQDWWNHTSDERYKIRVVRHAVKTLEAVTYRSLQAKPGDMLLVKAAGSRVYNHGGIVIAWPRLIHAVSPEVEIVDGTQHHMWAFRPVEVYSPWLKYQESLA